MPRLGTWQTAGAALALSLAGAPSQAIQSPWTPSWVASPTCRLVGSSDRQSSQVVDPYSGRVACDATPAVLSCDADNAVAFDLERSVACQVQTLPWRRARLVSLAAGRASVQTLEIDSRGRQRVHGTRLLDETGLIRVPADAASLVRVLRTEAAPVTLDLPLDVVAAVQVPPPTGGGEVIIGIADQPFPPVDFVLSSSGVRFTGQVRQRRWTAMSGVPVGTYRMSPRYVGGAVGPPSDVAVRAGATSTLVFGAQDVGALVLDAEGSLCGEVDEVRVVRRASRSGVRTETEVAKAERSSDCRYRFEGLTGGQYAVLLVNRTTGPVADIGAEVVPLETTVVVAPAPSVRVLGSVLQGGRPLAGSVEVWLSSDHPGLAVREARSGVMSAGAFELTAPEPGSYVARVAIDGLLAVGTEKRVTLHEGGNRLDWNLPAGRITVDIDGWDRQSAVSLDLRLVDEDHLGLAASSREVRPYQNLPLLVQALRPGTFELIARQSLTSGEQRTSERRRVTIKDGQPDPRVTLTLRAYAAEVAVVGADFRPIVDARVTVGDGEALVSSEPGLFRLTASVAEPGAPLMISAPGHAPTCVPAPDSGRYTAVLVNGVSSLVTFTEPPTTLLRPVGRVHWGGLACELPVSRFPSEAAIAQQTDAVTFLIGGLPVNTVVTLVVGGSGLPTESVTFRSGQAASLSLKKFR